MNNYLLLAAIVLFSITSSYSQSGRVGIGTSNPEQKLDVAGNAKANDKVIGTRGFVAGNVTTDTAKAIFSTDITNKGFYIPRLTTSQKNALSPASANKGLLVFDTDLNRTDFWSGTAWKAVGDGAGGPPTGAAGGDLTGNYPAPIVDAGKIDNTKLANDAVTTAKIANNAVTIAKLPSGATSTTFLRGDGTWVNNSIPQGVIVMWSGTKANIPTGWALCDGSSGTPDLTDRFIMGVSSTYDINTTGGANNTTLTTAQLPSHTHGFTTGSTTPSMTFAGAALGNHSHAATFTGAALGDHSHTATFAGAALGTHTHTATFAGNSVTSSSNGTHTHSIDPPSTNTNSTGAHTHTVSGTAANAGDHTHLAARPGNNTGNPDGANDTHTGNEHNRRYWRGPVTLTNNTATSSNGAHTHSVSGTAASAGDHAHSLDIAAFSSANAGAHTHTLTATGTVSVTAASAGTPAGSVSVANASAGTPTGSVSVANASAGTPSGTISGGAHTHTGTTDATGTGTPIDNRPAFFKLAFIIKL
ncbi:MAG TPA: hypothetical protein PL084_12385 [Chitinophagales bacterium]|nr:hypothetical protein [Chitinophagales bacterium]HRP38494.1 hypothetical protein [Chitinophagales bacterium]